MSPKSLIASLFLVLPGVASSDMTFSGHPLPPRITAFGTQGQTVIVSCGNGGLPAVTIIGPRPVGGPEETYVLRVPDREERLVGADCGPDGCLLDFGTMEEARAILEELEHGGILEIGF